MPVSLSLVKHLIYLYIINLCTMLIFSIICVVAGLVTINTAHSTNGFTSAITIFCVAAFYKFMLPECHIY